MREFERFRYPRHLIKITFPSSEVFKLGYLTDISQSGISLLSTKHGEIGDIVLVDFTNYKFNFTGCIPVLYKLKNKIDKDMFETDDYDKVYNSPCRYRYGLELLKENSFHQTNPHYLMLGKAYERKKFNEREVLSELEKMISDLYL